MAQQQQQQHVLHNQLSGLKASQCDNNSGSRIADAKPPDATNAAATAAAAAAAPPNKASRVHILAQEDPHSKVAIKTMTYVDLVGCGANGSGCSHEAGGKPCRPLWVPAFIPQGNWSLTPSPCYWKTDFVKMEDLEAISSNLVYNPLTDYSLELVRWHRPDLFDNIFQLFCVYNRKIYSERQLARIKEDIRLNAAMMEQPDSSISQKDSLAATLKTASLTDDFLPEIEHYLTLLAIRAFRLKRLLAKLR